jgi:hypothetical protein
MSELANDFEEAMSQAAPMPSPRGDFDKFLFVEFFEKPKLNLEKSRAENKAVHEMQTYIRICIPGERDTYVGEYWVDPMHPWSHSNRFGDRHKRWIENKKANTKDGTPLEALTREFPPILQETDVENLAYNKVFTVEQFLAVSDSSGQKIHGFNALKERVQRWVDVRNADKPNVMLKIELDKRDQKIAELQAQMTQLIEAQKASAAKAEVDSRETAVAELQAAASGSRKR